MGDEIALVNDPRSNHDRKSQDHAVAAPKPKPKARGRDAAAIESAPAVGSKSQATFLSDGVDDVVANGEAGFSRRMLMQTNAAANERDWSELELRNVVPATKMADWQIRQRAREQEEQKQKKDDNHGSTAATYAAAEAFCLEHSTQISTDVADEKATFTAYNSWIPRANGFYSSLMRLRAQEKMLGVKDLDTLVQQLTKGLGDVSQVAARMQRSNDHGHAYTLQVPVVDGTLDAAARLATLSGAAMRPAYLQFQQELLAQDKAAVYHEGDQDRTRMLQIEDNKKFVRDAGTTIDLAMSAIEGAPANIATATNAMNRTGAVLGAAANKRQIMNGLRQTHNPTYLTIDAKGNQVVRNVQTGLDREMTTKPGDPYLHTPIPETAPPPGTGSVVPSVSDVAGKIVDFAYAGEVAKINFHLDQIKTRCDIIQSVSDASTTKIRIETFQNALNDFAAKCGDLQTRMQARRQQYLEFGVQLDNYARTDFGSQKAGLSPGRNEERYATIMTVVSTVREVVAMGRGAMNSFDSPTKLKAWIQGIYDRRERTDDSRSDIQWMKMPGDELQRLVDMYNQVDHFENNAERETKRLDPVDAKAHEVLASFSQGAAGSGSGGLY
jgi:hypothetical protein